MRLSSPVIITDRLIPGVKIGDAFIGIDYSWRDGVGGRQRYDWFIDLADGSEFTGDDLQSGAGGGDLQSGLKSLLDFLSACGESYAYGQRIGRPGENADLFPQPVAEWAAGCSDELSMIRCELEESPGCIEE